MLLELAFEVTYDLKENTSAKLKDIRFMNQEKAMFSSLIRNSVNTLLWVCKNQHHGPVTSDFISKRLGLSTSYLDLLLSKLKKMGYLVSYRGPGGGYCSNGKPESLLLIDLLRELDFNHPHKTQACNTDLCVIDKDLVNWLVQDFLALNLVSMSFADIINTIDEEIWGAEPVKDMKTAKVRKLKPLQIHRLPAGPNSVFNLAAGMSI
jgi:Rrf2 family iron-sulfur cluster assembly transcriptional regulator